MSTERTLPIFTLSPSHSQAALLETELVDSSTSYGSLSDSPESVRKITERIPLVQVILDEKNEGSFCVSFSLEQFEEYFDIWKWKKSAAMRLSLKMALSSEDGDAYMRERLVIIKYFCQEARQFSDALYLAQYLMRRAENKELIREKLIKFRREMEKMNTVLRLSANIESFFRATQDHLKKVHEWEVQRTFFQDSLNALNTGLESLQKAIALLESVDLSSTDAT